jgi:hypothetical protein
MTTNYPYNATLPPDPVNNTTIRYASLDTIKLRLGITTNQWDAAITEATVSAENAIDLYLGAAIDISETPAPVQITQAAENIAIAVFKTTDTPFGVAGSGEYLGEFNLEDEVQREFRSRLLRGFKVSWGLS